jgi:hypothetical protein
MATRIVVPTSQRGCATARAALGVVAGKDVLTDRIGHVETACGENAEDRMPPLVDPGLGLALGASHIVMSPEAIEALVAALRAISRATAAEAVVLSARSFEPRQPGRTDLEISFGEKRTHSVELEVVEQYIVSVRRTASLRAAARSRRTGSCRRTGWHAKRARSGRSGWSAGETAG